MSKIRVAPSLPFKNIGFAGLGLIGGSLCKALMPFAGIKLYAFDNDKKTVELLKRKQRFAAVTDNMEEYLSWNLDLGYLCMPVKRNIELIIKMGEKKIQYPVTDAGSTKSPITEAALNAGLLFCGGHPIAGKEVSGYVNSSADLLRKCLFILTPDVRFGPEQLILVKKLKSLHELLGCKVEEMSALKHDKLYSLMSHLPYLAASAVAGTVLQTVQSDSVLEWAGTGFKDTTRVGASMPKKWVEIVFDNADNLVKDLETLTAILTEMKTIIKNRNEDELFQMLNNISEFRRKLS